MEATIGLVGGRGGRAACLSCGFTIYADDMSVLRPPTACRRWPGSGLCWIAALAAAGCGPGEAEKFRALHQELNAVKVANIDLDNRLARRDATIEGLEAQLANLRASGKAPLEPLFAIDRIEVLDITSGTDRDGRAGDDAAVVYFRPVDRDRDVLKRGGLIAIKLFDHVAAAGSRQIGQARLSDQELIRQAWYGKFWTDHYKVIVPFAPDAELKPGQELDVLVEFTDAMTGRTFRARKVIVLSIVSPG